MNEPTTPPFRRRQQLKIDSCNSDHAVLFDTFVLEAVYCAGVKVLVMLAECCSS